MRPVTTDMSQSAQDLAADGAAVVRGFLAPGDAADLRRTVSEIYAVMDACERFPDRRLGQNFRVWDGVWLEALPKFLRQVRPDLAERYERSRRLVATQVARLLGPRWRYFPKRSYFRRHLGMTKPVGWHIDADGATVFAVASSVINVWMPLDKVGTDLPSLEIVPRSHTAMRGIPMLTGTKDRGRDDAFARKLGASSTPELDLGDALIFDQFVLHRTQQGSAKDAVRTACEFRFVRPSLPSLQVLSGWLRYKSNTVFAPDGAVAARVKSLLGAK
jgi:Phytanoyl-CoA dioxygenase (PhyH)